MDPGLIVHQIPDVQTQVKDYKKNPDPKGFPEPQKGPLIVWIVGIVIELMPRNRVQVMQLVPIHVFARPHGRCAMQGSKEESKEVATY